MSGLHVRRWSDAEFAAGRDAWQSLLARSDADPLFMSFDWVERWWRHHAGALDAELQVFGVYSGAGDLRALLPFYSHRGVYRRLLGARRLELLGCAWREGGAVFSEYLDLIVERGAGPEVNTAVADHLRAQSWDELLLCNLRAGSAAERLAHALGSTFYLRPAELMTGWRIALPADFATFVAALDSNARRKILHQRQKLGATLHRVEDPHARGESLRMLERWAAARWGGAIAAPRSGFHAELVAAADPAVRLTELRVGDRCISVMLNLRVGGTEYYLQSAFDAAVARGVSPGYLHLGHAIEEACRDGMAQFDFLAGRGLHREYKRDFGATASSLRTLQIVRRRSLRTLFGALDRLRGPR